MVIISFKFLYFDSYRLFGLASMCQQVQPWGVLFLNDWELVLIADWFVSMNLIDWSPFRRPWGCAILILEVNGLTLKFEKLHFTRYLQHYFRVFSFYSQEKVNSTETPGTVASE